MKNSTFSGMLTGHRLGKNGEKRKKEMMKHDMMAGMVAGESTEKALRKNTL